MTINILLCGVGGQGILLAAKIISAAAEIAGFKVAGNEIHGMAQRGGSVTAQVRYGEEINSPLIPPGGADLLASLEASEALRYAHFLKPGGTAAVSMTRVIPVTVSIGKAVYPADVGERLRRVFPRLIFRDFDAEAEKLGNVRLSNTIMTGVLSRHLPGIADADWREAVTSCVKSKFIEMNLAAFEHGRNISEDTVES